MAHHSLQLISTDFDGTIHEDFASPSIPLALQDRLKAFQDRGGIWVINTGREMASLMETLGRSHSKVMPDYLILVEREIYRHEHGRYLSVDPWNSKCTQDHRTTFGEYGAELAELVEHLSNRFDATFYDDSFSPLCAIARNNDQMDAIQAEIETFVRAIPELVAVRNDVYVRLSHAAYSKGTALAELGRLLGIPSTGIFAAGDHLNDLPMLKRQFAQYLAAPINALPAVKLQVTAEGGYLAQAKAGHGILEAMDHFGF
ncbi:MAG TPA: HAD hydrolase family protein [Candidatus Limnocylindria bacterium]|jgi:hydroxymethylpyrimidine pyrophosphatase-like HAD family hydrolase|nr:HAD hydrolase family protein [Candidatus Limnocylindria bacterium]